MTRKKGFTLIELLIVVTIIGILVVMAVWSISSNLAKARDSKRKADLERIKIAFEDYYGDKSEYPLDTVLGDCGADTLKPYLSQIPCDPKTKRPYCYIYDSISPTGQEFKILTSFENENDDIIAKIGCEVDGVYCGYESECTTQVGYTKLNFGISSSNISVLNDNIGSGGLGSTPTPTPSTTPLGPLPSTIPGILACDPNRQCNNYGSNQNAINSGCPITWESGSGCDNLCGSIPSYGLCAR